MDIRGLVESMVRGGAFQQVVNNPLSQFGTATDPYPFADLLPERLVTENAYTETGIRYRTPIANAGTRYSPVQIKQGVITGSMKVETGKSDSGAQFTGSDYDALLRLQAQFTGTQGVAGGGVRRPEMEAMAQLTRWADALVNQPLNVHNELNRANALVSAQIIRTGDDNYREVVNYPNPTGARVAAGGTWSNNAYDPWADIIARKNYLNTKGYRLARIITSTDVLQILSNNTFIKQRGGILSITAGTIVGLPGAMSLERLNQLAQQDGLPAFETNDRTYNTQTGYAYYLPRTVMLFIAATGRDERIMRGDLEPVVKGDTLGYTAVGRVATQNAPGKWMQVRVRDENFPHFIQGEAVQESIPVIADPEAVSVINTIA